MGSLAGYTSLNWSCWILLRHARACQRDPLSTQQRRPARLEMCVSVCLVGVGASHGIVPRSEESPNKQWFACWFV